MIKINWSEVEATKTKLLQSGATESLEMILIIFYHNKPECDKVQIRLGHLHKVLFELSGNTAIKSIFLYDLAIKKPYLRCEESKRVPYGEAIPNSGHGNIVADFDKMSPEARDVWLEIAWAQQLQYVSEEV